MTTDKETLTALLERVRAATGPLSIRDALKLWCLALATLTDFEPLFSMDEFGNGEVTFQWDMRGGGRQKSSMLEKDLPDRSIDAALALTERVLPGWTWMLESTAEKSFVLWKPKAIRATVNEFAPTLPLAIIAATLSALIAKA